MTVLFLPLAALIRDEATAKLCRQIPRLVGAQLEHAAKAHGVVARFLSSRGSAEDGTPGLVASIEVPAPSDLETTARMYGADLVVHGRFGLSERNLILETRIYHAKTRSEVFAKRFETYPSYFFDAVEELKVRIVQTLGVDLSDRERVALLLRPTESWQALLYFLLAEDDRYALTLGIKPTEPVSTLRLYREALTVDPEFQQAAEGLQHQVLLLLENDLLSLSDLARVREEFSSFLPPELLLLLEELIL
jgi:hypothetical protein